MRLSINFEVEVSDRVAARVRDLAVGATRQPGSPSGQYELAALQHLIQSAKILSLFLSAHPAPQAASAQNLEQQLIPQWTLDPSKPSFVAWDDGTSIEIPPSVEAA